MPQALWGLAHHVLAHTCPTHMGRHSSVPGPRGALSLGQAPHKPSSALPSAGPREPKAGPPAEPFARGEAILPECGVRVGRGSLAAGGGGWGASAVGGGEGTEPSRRPQIRGVDCSKVLMCLLGEGVSKTISKARKPREGGLILCGEGGFQRRPCR